MGDEVSAVEARKIAETLNEDSLWAFCIFGTAAGGYFATVVLDADYITKALMMVFFGMAAAWTGAEYVGRFYLWKAGREHGRGAASRLRKACARVRPGEKLHYDDIWG